MSSDPLYPHPGLYPHAGLYPGGPSTIEQPLPPRQTRLRPHMRWPFLRDASGHVACVEQDTTEHIQSCELAIASTPVGARPERPDFGWPWPELKTEPIDPVPLIEALNRFEPRVANRQMEDYQDLTDPATWHIRVMSEMETPSNG